MAEVIKTIGITGRDYSTITLFEAAINNTTYPSAGTDVKGECYDDSAFDEAVTFNQTDTNIDSITLSVASGERHDGTAGSGARIVRSSSGDASLVAAVAENFVFEWLEIDAAGNNVDWGVSSPSTAKDSFVVRNMIIHDAIAGITTFAGIFVASVNTTITIINNIIYDMEKLTGTGATNVHGINFNLGLSGKTVYTINNTVHNTTNEGGGSGLAEGIHILTDGSANNFKNNVVTDTNGDTSGLIADYDATITTTTNVFNNLSSDTSAPGANSLISKTSANQFVSTAGGTEDLHLKTGADAINAGVDLVTTPTGVNIDIDGRDRDAEGDIWDMGADEFVAVGGVTLRNLGLLGVGR